MSNSRPSSSDSSLTKDQLEAARARFERRLAPPDANGCWLWTGAVRRFGYGNFHFQNRTKPAHRFAWMLAHGPIPAGLQVNHKCDVPGCCNPDHLFLGTQLDNRRDCAEKGRTAKGERHWMRQYPERLRRGDSWKRHFKSTMPDRAKGNRNGAHTHPERVSNGERNGSHKLTEDQVRIIRAQYAAGGVSLAALGKEYQVDPTSIWRVVNGMHWKHVK